MAFVYKQFRIDPMCLEEGGHHYARAKIYRHHSKDDKGDEVKWSGDIGDYASDAHAVEVAQRWAIQWCNAHAI